MGLKFAELFVWFKSLSILKMLLYIAAVVVTAVGLIGYMIFYSMWRSRYEWMYNDETKLFRKGCEIVKEHTDHEVECGMFFQLRALIPVGLALAVAAIAIIVITALLWLFLSMDLVWKICFGVFGLCALVAGIVGFALCGITQATFFKEENSKVAVYKCSVLIQPKDKEYWVKQGAIKKLEDIEKEIETSKKYCKDSAATNGAMSAIIIVGVILDAIAFFVL